MLRRKAQQGISKEKLFKRLPIIGGLVAIGGITYVALYLERVPLSGRLRLQSLPPMALATVGKITSEQVVTEAGRRVLGERNVKYIRVRAVFERLLAAIKDTPELAKCNETLDWKVRIILPNTLPWLCVRHVEKEACRLHGSSTP